MFKKIFCFICVLILPLAFAATVSAANEACFSVSDITTNKNRLFDTNLSADSQVAAFVAEISYNKDELRFDGAKVLAEDAQLSVNSEANGFVKIAYLCESGASGDLIKLSFKSFTSDTEISFEVSQVIDKDGNDITAVSTKDAFVKISDSEKKADSKTDKSSEKDQKGSSSQIETSALENTDINEINLASNKNVSNIKIVAIVLSVVAVLGIGVAGFYLGRKSSRKNK